MFLSIYLSIYLSLNLSIQVLVEYIDYGNTEDIEASRLKRPLTENPLFALPPQLIKCKLHDVPPSQVCQTY